MTDTDTTEARSALGTLLDDVVGFLPPAARAPVLAALVALAGLAASQLADCANEDGDPIAPTPPVEAVEPPPVEPAPEVVEPAPAVEPAGEVTP